MNYSKRRKSINTRSESSREDVFLCIPVLDQYGYRIRTINKVARLRYIILRHCINRTGKEIQHCSLIHSVLHNNLTIVYSTLIADFLSISFISSHVHFPCTSPLPSSNWVQSMSTLYRTFSIGGCNIHNVLNNKKKTTIMASHPIMKVVIHVPPEEGIVMSGGHEHIFVHFLLSFLFLTTISHVCVKYVYPLLKEWTSRIIDMYFRIKCMSNDHNGN